MKESAGAPGPRVRITAAICAHNDGKLLVAATESLLKQSLEGSAYEILVIDNCSTDETTSVIAAHKDVWAGRVRVVHEDSLGLCHARNRALKEAGSPLVAFIDADAMAAPGWLEAIVNAFEANPRVGVVGGPIVVHWDHPRPRWWDARLDEALNAYGDFSEPRTLHYPRYPYGTNLAVRAAAVEAVGGFDPLLDRRGRRLWAGGDGEICLRLEQAGWSVWFDPMVVVRHRTAANRLRRRYVLRRAFWHGRSQYRIERLHGIESGRYSTWARLAWQCVGRSALGRVDLPFLKYLLFRVGYHLERTLVRLRIRPRELDLTPRFSGGVLQSVDTAK